MKSLWGPNCTALSREWHWNWQQILGERWKFLEANSKYISQKYFKNIDKSFELKLSTCLYVAACASPCG